MTTQPHAQVGAYSTHQNAQEDGRDIDKRALLTCAGQLKAALDNGGTDMKMYEDAIRKNQKLWTLFQVALCDADNPLPNNLKILLLNISRYIDRTSFKAITEFAPNMVTSLIDLNRTIATGLSKKPAATAPTPQAYSQQPAAPNTQPPQQPVMVSA